MDVAPHNIEIGRYMELAIEDRVCTFCLDKTADETHTMLNCVVYDIRDALFKKHAIQTPILICNRMPTK